MWQISLAGTALLAVALAGCSDFLLPTEPAMAGEAPEVEVTVGDVDNSRNVRLIANIPLPLGSLAGDLAFEGTTVVQGLRRAENSAVTADVSPEFAVLEFEGFRIIDISRPNNPMVLETFPCNGVTGDVAIFNDLVYAPVGRPQSTADCDSEELDLGEESWQGIRIFEVNGRVTKVGEIPLDCGSSKIALHPEAGVIYNLPADLGPSCEGEFEVLQTSFEHPFTTSVTSVPYSGISRCDGVALNVDVDRAALACGFEGVQIFDISDPTDPVDVTPSILATGSWQSAAFSWDGEVVAFTDASTGRMALLTASGDTYAQAGNYLWPTRTPGALGNFIPTADPSLHRFVAAGVNGFRLVRGSDLLSGASSMEAEFGHHEQPGAGAWASYWYNGHIYSSTDAGLAVYRVTGPEPKRPQKQSRLNPQTSGGGE